MSAVQGPSMPNADTQMYGSLRGTTRLSLSAQRQSLQGSCRGLAMNGC